jgi:predicted metal-dependent hydrolase/CheY-like chemotaxis protein
MTQTILALLDDLFLIPRVQDVVSDSGFELKLVAKPVDLGIDIEPVVRATPLTEPLEGAEAILVREISALQPSLILVDVNLESVPWAQWIRVLKTSAATRRIPILVFGPHVESDRLEQARQMGADKVLSRGAFHKRMPALIQEHARPEFSQRLREACSGQLSPKALSGIELHNQGQFFEAHEALEEAWMEAYEDEGYLYRSLLQFTVAYLHLQRGNLRGAQKMMLRIHQWLDPLPDVCRGVDIAAFKSTVAALRARLIRQPTPTINANLHPAQILLVS